MIQKIIDKVVGRKYISILRLWVPNMAAWGTVGGVVVVYLTDWKLILGRVPYIKGKFDQDE